MLKIQWIRQTEYPTLLRVAPPREYGKAPRLSLPPPKKGDYLDVSQLETILKQFGLNRHFETEEHAGGEVIYRSAGRNILGVKICDNRKRLFSVIIEKRGDALLRTELNQLKEAIERLPMVNKVSITQVSDSGTRAT